MYLFHIENITGIHPPFTWRQDVDIHGKPAKSDPYVRVRLGDFKFDDRKHAVDDVTDVDLYKVD